MAGTALTTPVLLWTGREFFTGAWNAARHRAADRHAFVTLGRLSAYVYGLVVNEPPGLVAAAGVPEIAEQDASPEIRKMPSPVGESVLVEFIPDQPDEYEFRCGMNVVHSRLIVRSSSAP